MNVTQWLFAHSLEIIGYLLAILLIPRILLERRHPGATVAWVLAIGLIPFLGVPLYFLIGGRRIKKVSKQKDWTIPQHDASQADRVLNTLPANSRNIARLMTRTALFSPKAENSIRLIDDGVEAYTALVEMIESAEKSIEIATFILGADEVGTSLITLLAKKARDGVQVRLLLDALGSLRTSGRFTVPLREAGGQVGVFLPILPVRRRWSANLRNHRKLTVVDGHTALVGGMNLAREYMGPTPLRDRWKDVSMIIAGPAADDVRRIFWEDWRFSTHEHPEVASIMPNGLYDTQASGDSIVQVVGDGPDVPDRPLYSGILAALNRAKERIWVVTPYFVPDDALSESLALAARLGCDVRIIVPERSNHPLVDLAGHSYMDDLIHAGVRFFLYQPGMLHAKLFSIDHEIAVVGSANMDIRSFHLNFEIASFLYDSDSVKKVRSVMEEVMKQCREISVDERVQKNKLHAFSEDICRVFSPLF